MAVSGAFGNAGRAVFSRGELYPNENETNVMDFFTFSTLGNAIDFGNLNVGGQYPAALSNGHGGL